MEHTAPADPPFWTRLPDAIFADLSCGRGGLTSPEASQRLQRFGPNADAAVHNVNAVRAVVRRLFEPLWLILLAAAVVSVATGVAVGGSIIIAILALSIGLEPVQEHQELGAAEALRQSVALKAEVKRDGAFGQIAVEAVVPGDIIRVRSLLRRRWARCCWRWRCPLLRSLTGSAFRRRRWR